MIFFLISIIISKIEISNYLYPYSISYNQMKEDLSYFCFRKDQSSMIIEKMDRDTNLYNQMTMMKMTMTHSEKVVTQS